jgi:hypothetical protein
LVLLPRIIALLALLIGLLLPAMQTVRAATHAHRACTTSSRCESLSRKG